jgi:hypothetical protein
MTPDEIAALASGPWIKSTNGRRRHLTGREREQIFAKTDSYCHLCGRRIEGE